MAVKEFHDIVVTTSLTHILGRFLESYPSPEWHHSDLKMSQKWHRGPKGEDYFGYDWRSPKQFAKFQAEKAGLTNRELLYELYPVLGLSPSVWERFADVISCLKSHESVRYQPAPREVIKIPFLPGNWK